MKSIDRIRIWVNLFRMYRRFGWPVSACVKQANKLST